MALQRACQSANAVLQDIEQRDVRQRSERGIDLDRLISALRIQSRLVTKAPCG
jgi:hypothetical protein